MEQLSEEGPGLEASVFVSAGCLVPWHRVSGARGSEEAESFRKLRNAHLYSQYLLAKRRFQPPAGVRPTPLLAFRRSGSNLALWPCDSRLCLPCLGLGYLPVAVGR